MYPLSSLAAFFLYFDKAKERTASLRGRSLGRSGGGAGKGRRAGNYGSRI